MNATPLSSSKERHTFQVSGSTLKIVAIVSMFIDHFAAIVLQDRCQQLFWKLNDMKLLMQQPIYRCMVAMRYIGRLAFPIYCFLLIEGFLYTRNRKKYALRLFLFALISEIPFDYAFQRSFLEFSYQNVFFTLFLGLLVLMLFEQIEQRFAANPMPCLLSQLLVLYAGILLAYFLRTDYSGMGILTIVVMYYFRSNRRLQTLSGCFVLTLAAFNEVSSFAIYPLITRYNGTRGLNLKYVFYLFYPIHLIALTLLSQLLGYR